MTGSRDEQALTGATLPELLAAAAAERADRPYAGFGDDSVTFGELAASVAEAQRGLAGVGVRAGDRVAVMLPNHLDHVVLIHALIGLGAIWVPVNTRLRGAPLAHVLTDSDPSVLLIDSSYVPELPPLPDDVRVVAHAYGTPMPWSESGAPLPAASRPHADDVVSIIYTSGTTGPAKGVQVTDRMLRAAALGVDHVSEPCAGDVYFLWEPLCHIGGAQVLFLPLLRDVRLALVERFSASRFWSQVADAGATHVHHLGGIIPMLLTREPSPGERDNPVRISWGGGMTAAAWHAAERRFGLQVRECYGMTEASSISTVNTSGADAGIGRPLPWFEAEVRDDAGCRVDDGTSGEITLRPHVPGLLTPGYFRNAAATRESRAGDWWRTGDRGRLVDGSLHFVGRLTDSVRHRGENVSAWEVEAVVNAHPCVSESAVVGVPAAEGEEDIKVFVTVPGEPGFSPEDLIAWCRDRLASYQVPRYVAEVEAFAKTPSLRIQKASLPRTLDGYRAW